MHDLGCILRVSSYHAEPPTKLHKNIRVGSNFLSRPMQMKKKIKQTLKHG